MRSSRAQLGRPQTPAQPRTLLLALLISLTVSSGLTVSQPPLASAAKAKKPDLTLGVKHLIGGVRVDGYFKVRNRGKKSAEKTKAVLFSPRGKRLKTWRVPKLKPSKQARIKVPEEVWSGFGAKLCVDANKAVRESDEKNNCRPVGARTPLSSYRPQRRVDWQPNQTLTFASRKSSYFASVPASYDATHKTPMGVYVWMHGCGGSAAGDVRYLPPAQRDWIMLSLGSRDGDCWKPWDVPKVMAAVDDFADHFYVDKREIVLGGYSSGCLVAHRAALKQSQRVAGVITVNCGPFTYNFVDGKNFVASSTRRYPVVMIAHTGDETFYIYDVRLNNDFLLQKGFQTVLWEFPGGHYEPDTGSSGTHYSLRTYGLPYLNQGWRVS